MISFEKNINKYTVAVDENDKVVLIDKNGNTSDVNVEMTESNLEDGRVICLYQDKTYIKTIKSLDSIDSIIYDLDSNLITEKLPEVVRIWVVFIMDIVSHMTKKVLI